jgi:predicted alpha/beta-fold hydrolase
MSLALRAAERFGVSTLLLNCRGSDGRAGDIYHSGLTADLDAAIRSSAFDAVEEVGIFGYSIGGHVALRYGSHKPDPRVRRIAAICSPLDLKVSARDFDAPKISVYRGHVMDGLKEIYTAAYQRNPRGILPDEARKLRRIRDWDQQIVAPRFGFEGADHYYESESVGPKLAALKCDSLYVGASYDPMVRTEGVVPYLKAKNMRVVWDDRAGHLGFGPDFTLGLPEPLGLEPQVLSWLFR